MLTATFVLALWLWAMLYPALNWPDEAYKVAQIGVDKNPYLSLLAWLATTDCFLVYEQDPTAGYLSNSFNISLIAGNKCYMQLKIANLALAFIIFAGCILLMPTKNQRLLFLLSLIWPASMFYVTGINQHVVFHLVSSAIIVAVIHAWRIWPFFGAAIMLTILDRSFVSLVVFLGVLMTVQLRPRLSIVIFIAIFIFSIYVRPIIGSLGFFLGDDRTLADLSTSLAHMADSPLQSLGLLFLSFVYLGGTNSVLGIWLDYALVMTAVFYLLTKNWKNADARIYFGSFLMTFFIVTSFIPTIQTFRYYIFIMPAVLHFLVHKPQHRQLYVAYAVIMNLAYLLQSGFLDV